MTHDQWLALLILTCAVLASALVHVTPERLRTYLAIGSIAAAAVALILLLVPA